MFVKPPELPARADAREHAERAVVLAEREQAREREPERGAEQRFREQELG